MKLARRHRPLVSRRAGWNWPTTDRARNSGRRGGTPHLFFWLGRTDIREWYSLRGPKETQGSRCSEVGI